MKKGQLVQKVVALMLEKNLKKMIIKKMLKIKRVFKINWLYYNFYYNCEDKDDDNDNKDKKDKKDDKK